MLKKQWDANFRRWKISFAKSLVFISLGENTVISSYSGLLNFMNLTVIPAEKTGFLSDSGLHHGLEYSVCIGTKPNLLH